MPVHALIEGYAEELTAIRRDLHEHPELGFEEVRTAAIVAKALESYGIDVTTGIGKTGVVGVLEGNRPGRTIGLRADMDALPIDERTNLSYASKTPNVMHACGHDAHTTMLLGAARYLSEVRDFAGKVIFIFQPAEEGLGGARAMIADGLFEKFPCDEIYGMHNSPYHGPGEIGVKPGDAMAGSNFFDIKVRGIGSHAASPEHSADPIVITSGLVTQMQSIVSRNLGGTEAAVLSITQFHSGAAYNVIPEEAHIAGTIRYFDLNVAQKVSDRIRSLCSGFALAHGIEIDCEIRNVFDVLVNDTKLSQEMINAASEVMGDGKAELRDNRVMGSEDFADMLRVVPGAYCTVGHKGDVPLHNPAFVLDDDILPVGASIYVKMVERRGVIAA